MRVTATVVFTVFRYLWLMFRAKLPWWKPSQAKWDKAHQRTGRAIYRLATRLGGAFVKLGQVLGARADFFPEAFVGSLRGLHDQVPARPLSKLRGHLEKQLGRPIDDVFETIEPKALAAASLAQVHRARLMSGEDVAVKIQYPEARKLFPGDLASLRRTVRVVRWLNKKLDLRALADELAQYICLELDFSREAESTERVRATFGDDERVRIPEVYSELSTKQILVLEFIDGKPITDVDALRSADMDLRDIAKRVAEIYCTMIFEHGFFHGDPHPGNLLARADGSIGLLDFGLAKELPDGFSAGVATMIVKTMAGDGEAVLTAARSIGFEIEADDPAKFQQLLKMILGDYSGATRALDLIEASSVKTVPPHFTLIVRVMVLLNGVSHMLVPGERIIALAMTRALAPHVAANAA
jgi:ubiquinone biosynthesis protein